MKPKSFGLLLLSSLFWIQAASLPAAEKTAKPPHWWEKTPLRILDLVSSTGQIVFREPGPLVAEKAAQFYGAEHLEVMDLIKGLDDRGFFFKTAVAAQKNEDYLAKYLPEAGKKGLRVTIYFNVHWYKRSFGDQHPDWVQTTEDGQPLAGVYETGTSLCINSPYRDWCFQVVRDLCAYPIDGIFYDGPIFFPATCYCRFCREKFRKLYGGELPSKKIRKGKPFQQLLEFQADSLTDFLRDTQKIIKSINPEIALYMNGGERGGNWSTGRLNRVLVKEQDILGSEGGFIGGDLQQVPFWKPGVTARLLETQSGGKPRVVFSATGHKPWAFSLLPGAELRFLYAETIANGAGVWFGMWPSEFHQPEMKAVVAMNRFLADHAAFYSETRSEARVAIVWPDRTMNFYQGSETPNVGTGIRPQADIGNVNAEFSGLTNALLRMQAPFDVLDDEALERESLGRYDLIILPNVACMSDEACAGLRKFVRDGGNVLSTFETSLYDETGNRRSEFALRDLLGVRDAARLVGPARWDYMKKTSSSPLLDGLDREFIPAPSYHLKVGASGARPLIYFTKLLNGQYDSLPELSDEPALAVNSYGRGQVAYFSGDLGAALNTFRQPELFRLVHNGVRTLSRLPVKFENSPASVEAVLRSQKGGERLLLHLINFSADTPRPVSRVIPLRDLRVSVPGFGEARKVYTLMRPQELAVGKDGNGDLSFVVPRLDEYEVVVIEK
jgi:hypothetical protein